jgi:hypothetical protein
LPSGPVIIELTYSLVISSNQRAPIVQRFKHTTNETFASEPGFVLSGGGTKTAAYITGRVQDNGVAAPLMLLPLPAHPDQEPIARSGTYAIMQDNIYFAPAVSEDVSDPTPNIPGADCIAHGFACGTQVQIPKRWSDPACVYTSGGSTLIDATGSDPTSKCSLHYGFSVVLTDVPGFYHSVPAGRGGAVDVWASGGTIMEIIPATEASPRAIYDAMPPQVGRNGTASSFVYKTIRDRSSGGHTAIVLFGAGGGHGGNLVSWDGVAPSTAFAAGTVVNGSQGMLDIVNPVTHDHVIIACPQSAGSACASTPTPGTPTFGDPLRFVP